MSDKIYEKVSDKANDTIYKEAKELGKNAVNEIVKKLEDRGYRRQDVLPIVKDGVVIGADFVE